MRYKLIAILLFTLTLSFAAERRALVIGIGEYPDVDYGWHEINGDNDIPLVKELLLANRFKETNIHTLSNEQATFKGISAAFSRLIRKASQGDIVYIHFSGHGQQISDLDGDESDGFDEAWVPYDALQEPTEYYQGQKHITDDMLNSWLHQLREKVGLDGKIVVVSDACHSGTNTRIATDDIIRGSSAKFIISAKSKSFKNPNSLDWISISACADKECNRQVQTADGKPCGSLTYALYLMRHELSTLSMSQLLQKLTEKLLPPFVPRPQTPQIEYPQSESQTTLF